jgi:hypothetical protein
MVGADSKTIEYILNNSSDDLISLRNRDREKIFEKLDFDIYADIYYGSDKFGKADLGLLALGTILAGAVMFYYSIPSILYNYGNMMLDSFR